MKRIIFILAIVLIVQISLVVANQFLKNESKSNHNKLPLVEFTVDDVTRLELSDQTENLTLAVKMINGLYLTCRTFQPTMIRS